MDEAKRKKREEREVELEGVKELQGWEMRNDLPWHGHSCIQPCFYGMIDIFATNIVCRWIGTV